MLAPRIDTEGKDAMNLTAELPGVEEKDVDVTLADGVLTIRGEEKSPSATSGTRTKGGTWLSAAMVRSVEQSAVQS